ncbi:exosome complex component RRP46, partial [Tremellales sp. Uapishka_1]
MRPLSFSTGHLDRADGSAKFAFGTFLSLLSSPTSNSYRHLPGPTSSLASVTGPIEVRLRDELIDRATLEIVHRPLDGVAATPSRALTTSLQSLLSPLLSLSAHPRSLIQIIIQNLSPGMTFSSRAASINAACVALLDSGAIALKAIPLAVAVALIGGRMVVDAVAEEEEKAEARFGFGWAFGRGIQVDGKGEGMQVDGEVEEEMELVWVESEGSFSRGQVSLKMLP